MRGGLAHGYCYSTWIKGSWLATPNPFISFDKLRTGFETRLESWFA